MMYLIDTNIFLEILLNQEKKETCQIFLTANIGTIHLSDFSLHSIGVILFRQHKEEIFHKFINDVLPGVELVSLPEEKYQELVEVKNKAGLDFDDAYQYKIAEMYNLEIVTMDQDFEKGGAGVKIRFL